MMRTRGPLSYCTARVWYSTRRAAMLVTAQEQEGTPMSDQNSSFEQIQEHRAKIDELDRQIVALLNKRAGHSLVIRGLKPGAHLVCTTPNAKRRSSRRWTAITKARSITITSARSTVLS